MVARPRQIPDGTTSHSTRPAKDASQVAGYDETTGHLTRRANDTRRAIGNSTTAELRESLRGDRLILEQNFLQHGKVSRLLGAHSRLIDRYLQSVWKLLALPQRIALVAVGGYGRGELYPYSDIDLLILLDSEPDEDLQQKLQQLIGVLWDIGMDVGHSIRTVDQCLNESADITVQTNLMEARLLIGDAKLFGSLHLTVRQHLDPRHFFLAKLDEQQQRHKRFLDSDFNLEPNLKESPGRHHQPGRGAPDRKARHTAENPARALALSGWQARRPADLRVSNTTGRANGHQRFGKPAGKRAFDATLLPDQIGSASIQHHHAAAPARSPVR